MPVDLNEIFNPTDMASLLSAVIIEKMTDEQKAGLVTQAFEFMMTPRKQDTYGRVSKTPVQEAFERALDQVVVKVAHEIVEADPSVKARVDQMIHDAIVSNLEDNSAFREAVANGVRQAMSPSRY